jgi:hypothetical protein
MASRGAAVVRRIVARQGLERSREIEREGGGWRVGAGRDCEGRGAEGRGGGGESPTVRGGESGEEEVVEKEENQTLHSSLDSRLQRDTRTTEALPDPAGRRPPKPAPTGDRLWRWEQQRRGCVRC